MSVKAGLLNIKNGLNADGLIDRKKGFDEICVMFTEYMADYNKSGVIRFLTELTQKLRESGVWYTVESFDGEINVKDILTENPRKMIVDIGGTPKEYTLGEVCSIVCAYENILHCKEHAGEHLHSEEYLKIIQLRRRIECLERNSSEKDELIEIMKKNTEETKKKMAALNDRHQSDCIIINQLNVCIDILCEKYSILREIHGHKEGKLCGY